MDNTLVESPRIVEYERTEPDYCRTQYEDNYKRGVPDKFKSIWFGKNKAGQYFYGEILYFLSSFFPAPGGKPLYDFNKADNIFKEITKEDFEELKKDARFSKSKYSTK